MKKERVLLLIVLTLMVCIGCKKNNPIPKPTKATLATPIQNAVCTTGTILSDTRSTISFVWVAASNTESYNLVIINLLTKDSTVMNTNLTQFSATLLRNTPYAWYVISTSSKTTATAKSDIWKFYNSGPGVVSYAPFPAEITSPTFAQSLTATNGTINLSWTGTSVIPGTIAGYDVYLGFTNTPAILKTSVTDSFLNNVTVLPKTTYYWKVITKDIFGNTSDSGLYQFTVN